MGTGGGKEKRWQGAGGYNLGIVEKESTKRD